jgi:uncharacterized protein (DUF427 family)
MESVWDYPRPPRVEPSPVRVVVELDGEVLADTRRSLRVAGDQPPARVLHPRRRRPCRAAAALGQAVHRLRVQGRGQYYDAGDHAAVAWSYPSPSPGYEAIEGHYAFYPGRVDAATVDGEQVEAQAGDFYGGWITSAVTGPFKGGPGTTGW